MTIRDIAKLAGVSPATVSRALNDSPEISMARKEQIRKIAREHQFEFNSHARALSLQRDDTICLVTTDNMTSTAYIDAMTRLIRRELEISGYDLLITTKEHLQRLRAAGKVSAVICMDPSLPLGLWDFLRSSGMPCAAVHFRPVHIDHSSVSSFYTDHAYGGYLAARCLLESGRKRLLCLSEGAEQPQFLARLEGVIRAHEEFGLSFDRKRLIQGECTYQFGYQSIRERKVLLKEIDGICALADILAAGAIKALSDLELRIPENIALTGYDDMEYASYLSPGLTTIHQPKEQMAKDVCEYIMDCLTSGSRPVTTRRYVPFVVFRESCPSSC